MNEKEKQLSESLLPCPHCGQAPVVGAIDYGDERDNDVDVWFLRNMRMGKTYYRIECCAMMEGLDWDEISAAWNRRKAQTEDSAPQPEAARPEQPQSESQGFTKSAEEMLQERIANLRAKLEAKKAADRMKPRLPMFQPRYDDVYFDGLAWLNGDPLPDRTILLSIRSEIAELKELIAGTPKEDVIDRKSLEARLRKVAEEGWELLRRWPEIRLKELPEYAEMDREFNEMRRRVREELERGLLHHPQGIDL